MIVKVLEPMKGDGKELKPGVHIKISDKMAVRLFLENKVVPIVSCWLDRLSDEERQDFAERVAIMESDSGVERELAEVETIKIILSERPIPGKCDKCERSEGCMMTPGQRQLCAGPYLIL